jgi:uncharacterized protein YdcH (DUF465 family)
VSGETNQIELLKQMNAKLDKLLSGQKSLERRIRMLEEDYQNKNIDEKFADVSKIIKFFIILYLYLYIY